MSLTRELWTSRGGVHGPAASRVCIFGIGLVGVFNGDDLLLRPVVAGHQGVGSPDARRPIAAVDVFHRTHDDPRPSQQWR
jgi:hypothetical protein